MATRIRLGELLVRAGVIDELKLKAALSEQQKWGGRLGKILVEMNFVSEDLLVKALSKQLGVPRATFAEFNLPPELIERIGAAFAQEHGLCPEHVDASRRVLRVATADPTNVAAMDELRFRTGLRIETTLAGEIAIEQAIQRYLRAAPTHGIEVPEAIELEESSSSPAFAPNPRYHAAMAASGLAMDDDHPTVPAESGLGWSSTPAGSELRSSAPSVAPAGSLPPGAAAAPPASTTALDLAARLDGAQKQQAKALRAMVELMIEKGVFTREEYLAFLSRR